MAKIGRRIFFDTEDGSVLLVAGEMECDTIPERKKIQKIDYIDLQYGQDSDKFSKAKLYHVDLNTKQIVFDEFYQPKITPEQQQVEELQNKLLITQGVV